MSTDNPSNAAPTTGPTNLPTVGSATVHVAAPAQDVYEFLTDLDRLPLLSPENQRCEFLGEHDSIEVGSRFRGHNKAGTYEWHADCEVITADPGREFAYEVPPRYEHATTWRYTIEPDADGDGCTVTESFDAPMLALPDVYPGRIEGRHANLVRGCEITMAKLASSFSTGGES